MDDNGEINLISNTILYNSIKNDNLSHAYIFETNNSIENKDFVFSFIKNILCPIKNYKEKCNKCSICKRIDNNNYNEIKIIEPDGLWIRKEQLLELQECFKSKSLENNKMIYIITEAEKLNVSSANTMLKFLEEPESNIIAILLTNNVHKVIDTVVSRCQVINCKKKTTNEIRYSKELIDYIMNFVLNLEEKKENVIAHIDELWNNKLDERENQINAFEILLLIYFDTVNLLLKKEIKIFKEYNLQITKILKYNTLGTLQKKIYIIDDIKEKFNSNSNTSLLIDKLIYRISGVD